MITFGPPRNDVLAAYLANARWEREESGITIDGVDIATDRVSQGMINGAVAYLREDETIESIEFKTVDGFATIGRNDMVLIGKAVAAHVQACFAVERSILADITSGTVTTAAEIEAALDAAFS
jgi:hypothetical protein